MRIKQINIEASLAAGQYVFHEDKTWFVNDEPSVHTADGILSVYLDRHGIQGTFHGPNQMFNAPTVGNLIKVKMGSGNDAYFLVTSWTQDYVSCKGNIVRLCYSQHWHNFIKSVKVE